MVSSVDLEGFRIGGPAHRLGFIVLLVLKVGQVLFNNYILFALRRSKDFSFWNSIPWSRIETANGFVDIYKDV